MISEARADGRRAVRRLALARVISATGSTAAFAALVFVLYDETGSTAWVSAAVLVTLAANGILMPLGGLLGDRFDRRRVMIASDLGAAAFFGVLAFVHDPLLLVAIAFVATLCELPFFPASSAAIPVLAEPEDLAWANGQVSGATAIGLTAGPVLSGIVIAGVGGSFSFAINAISFLVSAAIVISLRGYRFNEARGDNADTGMAALRAGFEYVARQAALRALVVAELVAFSGIGIVIVADAPMAVAFDAGSVGYGLLITFWGGGMVLGSWLAGRLTDELSEPRALLLGMVLIASGLAASSVMPNFVLFLLFTLVGGLGNGVINVTRQSIVQRRTPDDVRSRVFAALEAIANVTFILSLVVSGIVVDAIGPRWSYAIGGITFFLGALYLAPAVTRATGALRVGVTPSSPG